jgi:hypothetical protein
VEIEIYIPIPSEVEAMWKKLNDTLKESTLEQVSTQFINVKEIAVLLKAVGSPVMNATIYEAASRRRTDDATKFIKIVFIPGISRATADLMIAAYNLAAPSLSMTLLGITYPLADTSAGKTAYVLDAAETSIDGELSGTDLDANVGDLAPGEKKASAGSTDERALIIGIVCAGLICLTLGLTLVFKYAYHSADEADKVTHLGTGISFPPHLGAPSVVDYVDGQYLTQGQQAFGSPGAAYVDVHDPNSPDYANATGADVLSTAMWGQGIQARGGTAKDKNGIYFDPVTHPVAMASLAVNDGWSTVQGALGGGGGDYIQLSPEYLDMADGHGTVKQKLAEATHLVKSAQLELKQKTYAAPQDVGAFSSNHYYPAESSMHAPAH